MVIRNPPLGRRSILGGAGAAVMAGVATPARTAELNWQSVASSEVGFSDLEARADRLVTDKRVWNLHGVVVARGGRLVFGRIRSPARRV